MILEDESTELNFYFRLKRNAIDLSTANTIQKECLGFYKKSPKDMHIDLSVVGSIHSAAFGNFQFMLDAVRKGGHMLHLVAGTDKLMEDFIDKEMDFIFMVENFETYKARIEEESKKMLEVEKAKSEPDFVVIKVEQTRIDMQIARDIHQMSMRIIKTKPKHIHLNFNGVRAINSAGIGNLVVINQALKKVDKSLYIVNASKELKEFFHELALDDLFIVV